MSVGGFFDAAVDFASDLASDFAGDFALDSFVDGFGTEFLTDIGSSVVDIGGDLFTGAGEFFGDIGGSLYETVGSFAGDATWFNATSFGDILSGPTAGFSEIFGNIAETFPGPTNFIANTVNNITASIPQVATGLTRATISNATGLPPNLIPGFGGGGLTLPGFGNILSAPGGLNPAIVPGIGGLISTTGIGGPVRTTPAALSPSLIPGLNLSSIPLISSFTSQTPVNSTAASLPQPSQLIQNITSASATPQAIPTPNTFTEIFNSETGLFDVYNLATNEVVASGLSQQEAILTAQDLAIDSPVISLETQPQSLGYEAQFDELTGKWLVVDVNSGQVIAGGLTEQEAILFAQDQSVIDGGSTPVIETGSILLNTEGIVNEEAGNLGGLIQQARQQQTIRDQRQNKAQAGDWRVRLRLAPQSNYLYNDPNCGAILWPLRNTDGVIFPYTPAIDTAYKANYEAYDLTHSNYRGYFYKGSSVESVNVRAMFTAQDTGEANYLLAVIHFFRSATKMFYGQDSQRGSPPPLVYLSGLGDYQFNEHPCAISQFNYTLPNDVDYIRAQSSFSDGTNLLVKRDRQTIAGNPLSYALQRLATVGLSKGALDPRAAPPTLGVENPTYVPTKMEISLTLLPIQSREQVSKQFSLKNFANGNLLKGGFW